MATAGRGLAERAGGTETLTQITYIVLVNWNGWKDTLECLESLFRLEGADHRVVVCDNGSEDGSLDRIRAWAAGRQEAPPAPAEMAGHSRPPCAKPVACQSLTREQAEQGREVAEAPLILIDCGANLGFAGGNNVGLRYALRQPDMAWAWLLNNDTVADRHALRALLDKARATPGAGIIGSTVVYYHRPQRVQAFGGARYFHCIGLSMHIGRLRNRLRPVHERRIESQMDYVLGASMFVSRAFVEAVGPMSEDYFLYYEELDWALRARGRFTLAYAQHSRVYHKAGATIGSSNRSSERSLLSDRHLMANRLRITRRFHPHCLPTVRGFLLVEWLIRRLRGRKAHAGMIWRLITEGPSAEQGRPRR